MKIRIVIEDHEGDPTRQAKSEVWSGEIDILRDNVYVTKISILADGEPMPICDIPFSLNKGWYAWIPGIQGSEDDDSFFLINPGQVIEADAVSAYPLELTADLSNAKEEDE